MIPAQLQNLNFCRIKKGTKKPFEKEWQKKPYSHSEIDNYLEHENYGILCGHQNVAVIDFDNKEFYENLKQLLPPTFEVSTGSGGVHLYYYIPDLKKKIILYSNIDGEHLGEVQSFGTQVVGPGSLHPNGNYYTVKEDRDIQKIELKDLQEIIKAFVKDTKQIEENAEFEKKEFDNQDELSVDNIFSTAGLKKQGSEYFGENPVHGSTGGSNFWINLLKNTWHCFRCNSGGSWLSAIAVKHGLINCSEAQKGKIRGDLARKCIEIAKEHYGFKPKLPVYSNKSDTLTSKKPESIFSPLEQTKFYIEEQPIYYDTVQNWWVWNNDLKKWDLSNEVDILNHIERITGKDIITPNNRTLILNSLKQECRKTKPLEIKDTWIQFKDTVVDIKTGLRFPATPDYFVTNPIQVQLNSDGNSNTPTIDKIFEEWVGKDYVKTLYQIIAYSLLPSYPIHRIFTLIGNGMNGKSCFLKLLKKFIGSENITSTELYRLTDSRFEVTRLHKKLVAMMGETNFTELKQTALLKSLSGGDDIAFEYKGKNGFTDVSYAKLIIATNNLPTTVDKTVGWYRRWCIIDFPNTFTEKIDILSTIPDSEYESLALKCVELLQELLIVKEFHNEGSLEERTKKYEAKSDFLQHFMDEYTQFSSEGYIFKSDFYKKFREWCLENKHRIMAEQTISKKLKERDIEPGRKYFEWLNDGKGGQIYVFLGISWKN
jgi:P4 family phage/plasmid primase-like protien